MAEEITTPTVEKPAEQAPQKPTEAPVPAPAEAQKPVATPPPYTPKRETAPSDPTEALKAQLTALQERITAMESQRTVATRTSEIEGIIAPLSDTLKAIYKRTDVSALTDEEYAQLKATIEAEVKELTTAERVKGALFGRPKSNNIKSDNKASDRETAEVLRRLNL